MLGQATSWVLPWGMCPACEDVCEEEGEHQELLYLSTVLETLTPKVKCDRYDDNCKK